MSHLPFSRNNSDLQQLQEAQQKYKGQIVNWFVNGEKMFRSGKVIDVLMDPKSGIQLKIQSEELGDEQGADRIKIITNLAIKRANLGPSYEISFRPVTDVNGHAVMSGEKSHLKLFVDGRAIESVILTPNLERQVRTLAASSNWFITSFAGTPNGFVAMAEPLLPRESQPRLEA